jgi:hypothetical protein
VAASAAWRENESFGISGANISSMTASRIGSKSNIQLSAYQLRRSGINGEAYIACGVAAVEKIFVCENIYITSAALCNENHR